MKVGDRIILKRRYSDLNGWSIRPDLDDKMVEIIEIEDRPNGSITAVRGSERLAFFRDAVGTVLTKELMDAGCAILKPGFDEIAADLKAEIDSMPEEGA